MNKIDYLNKKEVYDYYADNYHKMKEYLDGKKIMAVQMVPYPVIRKHEKGKPIIITKFNPFDKSDRNNFFYYPDKHYVDFHIIHGPTTDIIPIDIDPNNVSKGRVETVTRIVKNIMKSISDDIEVFHSGGRGYHIMVKLKKPINTRLAKSIVDTRVAPIVKNISYITDRPPEKGEIRIDTSTLHPGGSIRVPYSINYKTGIPSRKVNI